MQSGPKGFKDVLGFWKNREKEGGQPESGGRAGVKKDLIGRSFAEQEQHLKPGGGADQKNAPDEIEAPESEHEEAAGALQDLWEQAQELEGPESESVEELESIFVATGIADALGLEVDDDEAEVEDEAPEAEVEDEAPEAEVEDEAPEA
ncbi:MAG TPA: hypothetical protein PK095_11175, partial [Myxococcota bacterium]|nr:hypothetical protein [Myxococcota bacterium]